MRTIYTLLLLLLLCTGVRAQNFTMAASIGLAEDYCTGTNPDPATDCLNIPAGEDMLSYLPGQDGDILITYRFTNNTAGTITRALITDSDRGTIVPVSNVNVGPGRTVTARRIFPAETLPRLVTATVTATVENAAGTSATVTGEYTLDVVAPDVDIEFGVARQADVCDNTIAPNCGVPYGALNGQTVTVGALDTFTTRFAWTNSGLSTYDLINIVDQDNFTITNTGFDQTPGQTLIYARHWEAPAMPGTYNYSQTLTITDQGGNMITETVTYIVIVEAPMVEVEFGVARQADVCDNTTAPNCGVPYGALNGQTVTVGALDTFTTRFAWTNTGLGTWDMETVVDQDNFQSINTSFNQTPGQTLINARHWSAPATPGTYNFSLTLTVTDLGGNTATATVTYIVIVEAPMVEVEFGVARQADVCDNTTAPNCNVPYGALNGQTIIVGALDTFTTRFAWTNTGLGTWDMETVVDQDNFQSINTSFNQTPGQTLINARHWSAPAIPDTYNFSLTLTITDLGGNIATRTVTYIVKVEEPMVAIEFGVANQNDVCPDQPSAPNCVVPYGPLNGQLVTVGAGDTLTTRFAWTNTGLGEWDLLNLVDQDGEVLANIGFDQQPGQTLISAHHLIAPDAQGTYDRSQTLTITDKGGNVTTRKVTYQIKVDCGLSDLAPPVALCRDRTFTILNGETQNINAGMIDDGSFDGCGDLAGGGIDKSTFTCVDEGANTVTLTVGDLRGNSASCTATVTINVEDAIAEGISLNCLSEESAVAGGQAWYDVTTPDGKLIAQVIVGNNTNISAVRASVYKSAAMTEDFNGLSYLSKRISLELLDSEDVVVQPNNEPLYVRLYYTDNEFTALTNAMPSSPLTWTVVKTSGLDCGDGYSGVNATAMNTTFNNAGCSGEDGYFEFFTGSFSTFYLFATDAALPVELTAFDARATEKQQVQLDWKTETESGNSHFEIEHSTDASSFTYVGAVAGAGDALQEQEYDFLHETPADGVNYYRLRQVDHDGTETLSEVREVTITAPSQLSVFPNPARDQLSLSGFTGGPVRVLDLQGRTLISQNTSAFETLRISELPSGIYLLQAGEETVRWVKQ